MANTSRFLSPLPTNECAQRLQQLAARPAYEVALERRVVGLELSRLRLMLLDNGTYTYRLRVTGKQHSRRLPGDTVFFSAYGMLAPSRRGCRVTVSTRPAGPETPAGWLSQIAWYAILTVLLALLVVEALMVREAWLWSLAGAYVLTVAGFYAVLGTIHDRAVRALRVLFERAFAAATQTDGDASIRLIG